jgi:deazaflavin-dependent oxidoreductase (nitroreductase family)
MPSKATLIAMNAVHRALIAASFGRLGWTVSGMPALELTTTGRTSGRRRSTMLTSPVQIGDALVVVASRGGDDHHPAWFLNLEADGDVRVAVAGKPSVPMRARVMSDAEHDELWPVVTARYPNYAAYQRRTDRVIPLVLLEPVAGSTRS